MASELLARAQATIASLTDAYTLTQSAGEYIFPATHDGRIVAAATVVTHIEVTQGDRPYRNFTIGAVTRPSGFARVEVDNEAKSVVFTVTAGTSSLADHGAADIPIFIEGLTYRLAFVWSKARAGAAGADANLLDWVQEWDTQRTQIDGNTVITPKLFAGVRNDDGTLTGTAIGRYAVSGRDAGGTVSAATVDGISGFRDGYRTFFLDSGGSAQLGRGDQFVRYDASSGKVEFGAGVSLQWAGATYIDKDGLFTGTLSATTVSTVNLDATQITSGKITADHIDVAALKASLLTAGNIEALTLNVTRGTVGGWSLDGEAIFRGAKNNTSGAYTASAGAVTLGSQGLRGHGWRLEASGAGALAGGNISWDAAGEVLFGASVSLQWSGPISSLTAALGGANYPRLTHITAQGIYTGSLSAAQITTGTLSADRVAAGSLKAEKLDAASIRASIINTEYINGLRCTFTGGTVGGWEIGSDALASAGIGVAGATPLQLRTTASGEGFWYNGAYRPYGLSLLWCRYANAGHLVFGQVAASGNGVKQDFAGLQMMSWDGREYFCLSANTQLSGSKEVYNRIAGWCFDHERIWKNNVSLGTDGSIANGTKWRLCSDGSGQLAGGGISWNAAGVLTFAPTVSLSWTGPLDGITTALGGAHYPRLTHISSEGIYTGTLSAEQVNAVCLDAASIRTGTLDVERLDAAGIRSRIIDTDYISGLSCSFKRGFIGGWSIAAASLSVEMPDAGGQGVSMCHNAAAAGAEPWDGGCRPMGTMLCWHRPANAGHLVLGQVAGSDLRTREGFLGFQMMDWSAGREYFCLAANYAQEGRTEVYNRIAGWCFDHAHIWKNDVTLGEDGTIANGTKWQLCSDGSGRIAAGNICWDASGKVTFGESVSVAWSAGIGQITAALGGESYSKLTNITSAGIYTGSISAGQINIDTTLVVGGGNYNGSISVRDGANAVKATLDRTGITAVGGRIGGWIINEETICAAAPVSGHRVYLTASGYLYNDNPNTGRDFWGLKPDGSATFGYGTICFGRDGSGYLASENIRWDTAGNVELQGTITATGGRIAGFTINGNRLLNTAADSSIEFTSLMGKASLIINGTGTGALLSMRADSDRTAIFIQTYAPGAKGLQIVANCGSDYAIESYGPVILGQRASEKWNVPGVLYIGCKYTEGFNSSYRKIWGDGVVVSSFTHLGDGQYKVVHNLRHLNYTVFAQQWSYTKYHGFYRLLERATTYFVIQNVGTEGKPDCSAFDFIIFGQNTF